MAFLCITSLDHFFPNLWKISSGCAYPMEAESGLKVARAYRTVQKKDSSHTHEERNNVKDPVGPTVSGLPR